MFIAVIRFGGRVTRDGHGHCCGDWINRQRALLIAHYIIGRNCAGFVFDGGGVDHVVDAARVGDGGVRRHGEGEVFLRVAVDQTCDSKVGLGERLTVIGLFTVRCGDGQGHGVINRDDVLCFVRHDLDGLVGGIVGHRGVGVFRIQGFAPVRRQCFADGPGAGLVVGHLDRGGALQIMMDGVARGVELEVQLQHQRARARHRAGQHVVLVIRIEHVLVAFLGRFVVFGHGNGRVRRALALIAALEGVAAVRVLIVELNGVPGVRVRLPDGVKDVVSLALIVHLNLVARSNASFARSRGVPADKGIAFAGEGIFRQGRDGLIVRVRLGNVLARTAVGLVGQGHVTGTRTPNADEGHIVFDLILVAGLIDIRSVRPAEEVLPIIRDQFIRRHKVGIAVCRISLAIFRSSYIVFAGFIGDGEGTVLGVVGVKGDTAVNLGVNIERFTCAVRAGTPAAPRIAGVL